MFVSSAELERQSVALASRGEASVTSSEGETALVRADEVVETVSGTRRLDHWVSSNCEPSGVCHFASEGVRLERVDAGASARRAAEIGAVGLIVVAGTGGVACATGAICDSDSARLAGTITLSTVGALLVGGLVALATCSSCWATR